MSTSPLDDSHSGLNRGVAPVTYGVGDRPPRGDYADARADYTCEQHWHRHTPGEHALYRRLHERQASRLPGLACEAFIRALGELGSPEAIPEFDRLSERLHRATGWTVVAVPGLIPEEAFFSLLAQRRFPVTRWLRREDEFDYIVEPDVFHDLFGHVPLLFDPVFADYMQAYGAGGLKASRLHACEHLARLYWHTVEFGLIASEDGQSVRAYGAGLLSSAGELVHSVRSPRPHRIGFDLRRIMRTRYRIDDFQPAYFVIRSFDELFEATAPDFEPLYREVSVMPEIEAGERVPSDRIWTPAVA